MKKIIIVALALTGITYCSLAQGFYFRIGLGYALPQAGQTIDGNAIPYSGSRTNTTYLQTYNIKSASFTSGTQSTSGFGYQFTEHIAAQLDAAFGLSTTTYTFADNNITFSGYNANGSYVQRANNSIILEPSIVLQSGGSSSVNVYTRIGLAIPVITKITEENNYYIPSLPTNVDLTYQISNSFSLGFNAAAGLQYKMNDRMNLWGEISMLSLSLFIKESVLKSFTEDGVTYPLDSIGGPHKVTYSKNVSVDTNYAKLPTYSQPFSNIGIMIGFTFRLSHKAGYSARKHDVDIDENKPFRRR